PRRMNPRRQLTPKAGVVHLHAVGLANQGDEPGLQNWFGHKPQAGSFDGYRAVQICDNFRWHWLVVETVTIGSTRCDLGEHHVLLPRGPVRRPDLNKGKQVAGGSVRK